MMQLTVLTLVRKMFLKIIYGNWNWPHKVPKIMIIITVSMKAMVVGSRITSHRNKEASITVTLVVGEEVVITKLIIIK